MCYNKYNDKIHIRSCDDKMKPKQIISFILAVMLCAGCFGGLSVTAEELLSYTWDLTNCGEASGYVTPEDGAKQNNCTTLVAGETVSAEYTKNITAPADGMLSFNLSRDDSAQGGANTKAEISPERLVAPGNGTHT